MSWNGSRQWSVINFSVPCRGTEVCFREKIGVRPLCNRRRKFTSALNSTTTRTDSTVGTIQLYHQLLLLYRKHYDSLSLFYAHFFFHWAVKQFFFFIFLLFFITSKMAPRKKTPSVSKKPNQRTMVARKNTQVKSPRGKFNVSEVIRIVFINAYCQYSRFYNYSYTFKFWILAEFWFRGR